MRYHKHTFFTLDAFVKSVIKEETKFLLFSKNIKDYIVFKVLGYEGVSFYNDNYIDEVMLNILIPGTKHSTSSIIIDRRDLPITVLENSIQYEI